MFFEVLAQNQQNLAKFYATVFGWEFNPGGKSPAGKSFDYIAPPFDGVEVRGGIGNVNPDGDASRVNFYVLVDDLDATLQLVVAAGGQRERDPIQADGYGFAIFKDPEGNSIGIVLPFPPIPPVVEPPE